MRYGIIDCGTNTFNLLVVDIKGRQWEEVFGAKVSVKLGMGGFAKGTIQADRMARGLDALKVLRESMLSFHTEKVIVLATSAVRDAANAHEFISKIKAELGFDLNIIDGMREAELICSGVSQSLELGEEPVLIMDIGGGSTEFILVNSRGILWKESFQLGVSRLQEVLQPEEILGEDDQRKLHAILDGALEPLKQAMIAFPSRHLVGASGSFDTLQAMLRATFNPDFQGVPPASESIQPARLKDLHAKLLLSDLETRLHFLGMMPMRAETMPLASAMIQFVLSTFGIQTISRSSYALKEGVAMELIQGKLEAQPLVD